MGSLNLCINRILSAFFIIHISTSVSTVQINYRLSQPQIYVDDGHIYLVPAEHRNLVLVANGTGKILFNEVELNALVSSVKNSSQDLNRFKQIFGTPTNSSAGMSQRISSLEQTMQRLNLVESLDTRVTNVERQLLYNVSSSEESGSRRNSVNTRLRRLRTRIDTLETRMRGMGNANENPCGSNPCANGGSCIPTMYGPFCWCRNGWEGPTCQQDVNECANFLGTDLGCQNGATCVNRPGGYDCRCGPNWMGIHCTKKMGGCNSGAPWELCGHGICIDQSQGSRRFTCICDQGWKTDGTNPACTVDIDECTTGHPSCSINPPVACINTPGSFICGPCPLGYTGNGHRCMDINECLVNNGGCSVHPMVQCINTHGSRSCGECPPGYIGNGVMCQYRGICQVNNGGCHPLARCVENSAIGSSYVQCMCPAGYTGTGMGLNGCFPYQSQGGGGGSDIGPVGNPCAVTPCANSGICQSHGNSFSCFCMPGFTGPTCATRADPCQSQPCQNGGLCVRTGTASSGGFICRCTEDFTGDSCETQVESCGGVLTTLEGTLHYPHDTTQSYQHNTNCAWVIRTAPGKVLNVTFTRFHLEGNPNCNYDVLEVRDGGDITAPRIGKFCGETLPSNIISTHDALYFGFRSDHSIVGLGFEFSWNTTDPVCGGFISNQTHGSINSPGYPGDYPHNRDCVWSISVNLGKRIQLVFATFQIETHSNCSYDYMEVRDGMEEHAQVLATYCSTTLPPPLVSSGPFVQIRFHSDGSNTDAGFHVTFAEVPGIPGCGGVLSTPTGVISSPQHPEPYAHGVVCEWLIRLPSPMDYINLKFITFELEGSSNCVYDYVEIRDGSLPTSPLVGRFCGRNLPPDFNSRSSQLFVKFSSDESVSLGGFSAKYEAVCGGVLSAEEGLIRSPYYPNSYPKNRECIYLISQPVGKAIILDFVDFDVESGVDTRCLFDFLEIRDGDTENSTLIGHYCGPPESAPERIVSTHNYLWLKFKTDGSVQNRGFLANYSVIDTGCGGILKDTHGLISSPGHPEVYPHGVACTWIIRGVPGQIIRLTWATFSLEQSPGDHCNFDFVEIIDNSTLLRNGSSMGKFCGQNLPPQMTSTDNTMTINFRSDHSIAHDGFMANYMLLNSSTACGGEYFSEYGVIRSPRYPEPYPHRKTCVWIIKVGNGKQILLNVTDFEMENGTRGRCNFDYLEIRNGGSATSPLVGRYCGNGLPTRFIPSHSNSLYLKFSSDSSRNHKGFQIVWDGTTTGCGGSLNSPAGTIESPNYPLSYGSRLECVWTINVNEGSAIQLIFVDLDIQQSEGCWGEHIEIRDGKDRTSPVMGKYCHSDSILSLNSTGSALRIKFVSGFSRFNRFGGGGRGFKINYRATCNRVIKGFHGVIESPNFPNPYPHNRNCTWEIQAPRGNKVNVSFSHFSVEQAYRNNCVYDFVEVMEWKRYTDTKTSLGKFCGSNRPELISSTKDILSVNFVSDHSLAHNGFRMEWRVHGCGGRIIGSWAHIQSPNYPNMYANDVECIWHITSELGTKINLIIYELDIERHEDCAFDALDVYGGPDESSPKLAQFCHTATQHQRVTSEGNNMYIKFKSDGSVPRKGFNAEVYSSTGGCGGAFKALSGFIHSPNYPGNYNPNADCGWRIEVDPGHIAQLQFLDFQVERHINCSYDHVAVYDGRSSSDPLLLMHCGDQLPDPPVIRATGNIMFVRLKTDGSTSSKGFRANYSTGCGARLTGSNSGVILSPNFPSLVPSESNCSWIIIGPTSDDHVTLTFTTMNMRTDHLEGDCDSSYVEILDGEDEEAPSLGKYCSNTAPPAITSRGNALVVKLVSSYTSTFGFRAVYDHSTSACGGTLSSMAGAFTSPNYPVGYPANVECVWEIEATVGNKVELSFRRLDIETSEFCNNDFIEIHENNAAGRLLGHFCGNQIPGNLTAATRLWVLFRTDSEGQAPGFWADFNLVHGNELNGSFGEIASPGYPNPSHLTGIFTWRVTVNESRAIAITFDQFDFEYYSNIDENEYGDCSEFTSLTIYDGYDKESPILFRRCSGTNPEPVRSTGNVVFIEYEKTLWYNWFKISWREVQPSTGLDAAGFRINVTGCGGNFSIIEGNSTSVVSPFYPYNYPNNIRCIWGFDSPPHTKIKLQVMDLDFESHPTCQFDRVEVYDGRNGQPTFALNKTMCKRTAVNTTLITSGRFLQLVMQTDADGARPGFNFTLSTVCGGYLREPRGRITTPGYPNNYVTSDCEWIVIVRPGRTIRVAFEFFDIYSDAGANCETDELILRNGASWDSPFLGTGRYCGNTIPPSLETTSNKLHVHFKAFTHGRRGFALVYSEVSAGCGGEIYLTDDTPSVILSSPNFNQIPPPFTECEWIISAPQGEAIQLTFQISFDFSDSNRCQNAGIELRDGGTRISPEIGTFCREMPGTQKSSGNIMYVRYYTNVPVPRTGFKAETKIATCGGIAAGRYGSIQSPGYPGSYDLNLDCLWTIKGPESSYLTLQFMELDVNALNLSSENCTQDRVIFTEQNITGIDNPRNWTFCSGSQIRSSVRSSTNQIHIRFISDGQRESKRGFKLIYQSTRERCGGELRSPTGIIESPGYPQAYTNYRHCFWHIVAPEGRRVRLEFLDFDLEETYIIGGRRMCSDYVQVFNRQGYEWRKLYNQSLCGSVLPAPVETTTNRMSVSFSTDHSVAHRGFKARYSTDLPYICGGTIPALNGTISSPNVTTGTPNTTSNMLCEWKSEGSVDNGTIIVTLNQLAVPPWGSSDPYCPHGYLRLSPSTMNRKYNWKKYCGISSNLNIYIPGSSLHVEYDTEFLESSFSLSYRVDSCGGILRGPQDNITSPNSPLTYPVNTECIWIVDYGSSSQIKVKFLELDLSDEPDCSKDYIMIRNGKYQTSPILGKYCGRNIPQDIISMSSSLWIEFHSDEVPNNNRLGFKISTEMIEYGCGGVIHKKYGQLRSPKAEPGTRYPDNTECEWIIESVTGYVLNLVFTGRFDIENTPNCTNDAVEIFIKPRTSSESELSSTSTTWKSLGKFCGRQLPAPINTTSSSVKVRFRSNANLNGDGFTLTWYSPCGGLFTDPSGLIRSAHYDRFNHSASHSYGPFWTWMGWESTWSIQRCDYIIQGDPDDYIVVEFLPPFDVAVPPTYGSSIADINAECPIVNVTMWEGNSTHRAHSSDIYCGSDTVMSAPPFVGQGSVTISYNYKASYQNAGFRAKYSVYKCGGMVNEPGRISSPGHPFTSAPHMNCTWTVMAPAQRVVRLKFESLELEFQKTCSFDYVRLFDGPYVRDSGRLGTFCGNLTEDFHKISSKSNVMTVQFYTDWVIQHAGFAATVDFTVGENQGCGGHKNVTPTTPVTIQSVDMNSDGKYDSYLDCQWLISGPDFQALELTFQRFSLEGGGRSPGKNASNLLDPCPYDFVEIRDGGPNGQLLGKFCGSLVPSPIHSSVNFMWIRFVSDGSYDFPGFQATIRNRISPCGGTFVLNATKDAVKTLTSPGYPENYGNNIRCKWTIDGSSFYDEVDIKFIDMDIQASPGCANDRLEIKDVSNSYTSPEGISGPILFVGNGPTDWRFRNLNLEGFNIFQDVRYCGSQTPPDFFSVGRSAELVFHTDSSGSGKGFKIEYKAAGCNRTFENSQGRIFSPEYPTNSPLFSSCQFSIRAQNGSFISLYFNMFLLPGVPTAESECVNAAFEVRDGSPSGQLLGKYCSSSRPNPVFSTSSLLWVKYFTRAELSRGYDITYTTTSAGRGCGGDIFHTGGSFTSPFYPGNYSQETDCRWRVRVPAGLTIQIQFTQFLIGSNCATDFVEILSTDSHNPTATPVLFSRYCPGDVPSVYNGRTDMAIVRYKTSRNNTGNGWRAEFKGLTPSTLPRA